jgi:putative aldouronate transport system substrate-binding protein
MNRRISRRTFLRNVGIGAAALAVTGKNALASASPAGGPGAAWARQAGQTFSYWVVLPNNVSASLTSFSEMLCYQELEKRTGVHLEFQHAADQSAQMEEQFNLMIASGQYADIIERNWLSVAGGPAKYLGDGVILRLNDLIDQHAPNLKKVLDSNPRWRKEVTTDDGDLFCLPFLRGDDFLQTFQGPIIRKDWLDKLNMKAPTTIDEWHDLLTAFKEKDPNGNGQADEVPFTSSLGGRPLQAFTSSHVMVGAWGIAMEFYQENNVVKYGAIQPGFKDFLSTMAQWYKEGLYDPDFPAMDQKLEDAKITGNQLGTFIMNTGNGIGRYTGLMAEKDPNFKLIAAPYPTLKAGDKPVLGQRDNTFPGVGAAISTQCKNPEEAIKMLDYAYGDEGHMLFNFGVEGKTYTLVDGYPKYTELVTKDPKLPLANSMARYFRSVFNGPFVQDRRYIEQYAFLPEQQDAIKIWREPSNEMQMPPVTQTQDESKRFASITNDVVTLRDEAIIKIIVGQTPVAEWDNVVAQMKQIGIEEAITLRQAALERFNKR